MTKLGVARIATAVEPGTTSSAATEFARALDYAALGACRTQYRFVCHPHVYAWLCAFGLFQQIIIRKNFKRKNKIQKNAYTQKHINERLKAVYIDQVVAVPLQACMPSNHVCGKSVLPTFPHLLYQAPPRAQQLRLPDLSMVPHLGHTRLIVAVAGCAVAASDHARTFLSRTHIESHTKKYKSRIKSS